MKIGFDARVFRHEKVTGVERYARALHAEMKNMAEVVDFVPKSDSRYSQHIWVQSKLPGLAQNAGCDVLFCPVMAGPVLLQKSLPLAVTIHDLAFLRFPEMYSWPFRNYYKMLLPSLMRRADLVIALTEHERSHIEAQYPAVVGKVRVVYSGVESKFRVAGQVKEKLILAVSSINKHKNLATLLRAFAKVQHIIPHKLVLVGGGRSVISTDGAIGNAMQVIEPSKVLMTGYVSDEELIGWYERAELFVFPSLFEGFGLPPLEAMAAGCGVIASNRSCIPEVCGDGAVYFDAQDDDALADVLVSLASDEQKVLKLQEKGVEHSRSFSWKTTARNTIAALESIAK